MEIGRTRDHEAGPQVVAYELTGWRADLRTIVPAALAGAAAFSFAFGKGRVVVLGEASMLAAQVLPGPGGCSCLVGPGCRKGA